MKAVSYFLTLILASQIVSSSVGSSYSTTGSSNATTTTQSASSVCKSSLTRSYEQAIVTYPHLKDTIEKVLQQSVGQWFTDRQSDVASVAKHIFLKRCSDSDTSDSDDSRPPVVVVYGLPQKDCSAGFSSDGSSKNTADYRSFLQLLIDQAQNQRVIYILEPDAISLLAEDGCGNAAGYVKNLVIALEMLSANANADIYIDIGYWTLSGDEKAAKVAKIVEKVDTTSKSKGIALNTANFRSIDEMTTLCKRFSRVSDKSYHCIIDMSRNFVAPATSKWCNTKDTGMGTLPSVYTGHGLIDYFVWVKPPGESDGECTGQTSASLVCPRAETFFPKHFIQLWNNCVFVKEHGFSTLDSNGYTITITQTAAITSDMPSIQSATSDLSSPLPPTTEEPSATPTPTPTLTTDAASSSGGLTASATPVPTVVVEAEHVDYTIDIAGDECSLQYASSGAGDTFEPMIEEKTQDDAETAGSVESQAIEDEDQGTVIQDADTVDSSSTAAEQYPEAAQVASSEAQGLSYGERESEETKSSPAPATGSDTPSVSPTY